MPIVADTVEFRNHRCFKTHWAGFSEIKPINVIIGRNNTGKSHLLDLVGALARNQMASRGWHFRLRGKLREDLLREAFGENTSGGLLAGNHWQDHGQLYKNAAVQWETDEQIKASTVEFDRAINPSKYGERSDEARLNVIKSVLDRFTHPLIGRKFARLLADRDIRPESAQNTLSLHDDDTGATNIVRRFITTSNPNYPRELIQVELLTALNEIFGQDGQFTEIQVKTHDEQDGNWEIYLGEKRKGLVALSNSGSGLKTVFLVLLNLLVVPKIQNTAKEKYCFAFEELENNAHPALLRRLLQYIHAYAMTHGSPIFLTTHSSTALDIFGVSSDAQIIHVTHDGGDAAARRIGAHFDHLGVISELGAKPSDLLQANGIIWVEGPSDCIYINRWLDLYSLGKFQEGRDYQCAFYGGSLLARTQFASPAEAEQELINLFRVNSNIVVICDGDRTSPDSRVKDRVRRIRAEVLQIPRAHIWVTGAREIENYLPGSTIAKALGLGSLPDPGQYEQFFPRKGSPAGSYLEAKIGRKSIDKVDLAILSAPHTSRDLMTQRWDWEKEVEKIADRIESWNKV